MNKDEFMLMLIKPINECDGVDLHLRKRFKEKDVEAILYITGVDVSDILEEKLTKTK